MFLQEGASSFSVHGLSTRTNSSVEAYNGPIGRRMKHKSQFFQFVLYLLDEELVKTREFEEAIKVAGASTNPKRKFFQVNLFYLEKSK